MIMIRSQRWMTKMHLLMIFSKKQKTQFEREDGTAISMEVLEKGDGTVILMVDLESELGIVISLGGWAKGPGIKTSQVDLANVRGTAIFLEDWVREHGIVVSQVELESKLMPTLYKGLIFGMMNNIIMAPAVTRK